MKFRPLHDRIVVKRVDAEEKTKGGIIIPDTAKEKPQEGEVIAVGPGARDESGKLIPLDVKVGDRILFGKWSGTDIKLDGEELLIMIPDNGVGQHGRRRGAVASKVTLLRGDLAHHLRPHVLELVGEFDLLGDGDATLGDARRAEALLHDDVAALRAKRHADRVGQNFDAANHFSRASCENFTSLADIIAHSGDMR